MKHWWIGCSGYSYQRWRNKFYPKELPSKRWFEFYCEHFNTVELNVTFYRFPKLSSLQSWYARSPDDFMFTVKAPRFITHFRRFKDVGDSIAKFYDVVSAGLKGKLGTILFQLHPQMKYSTENLERILNALNTGYNNVLEFRHESWWREETIDTLKRAGVSFCGISYPSLPDDVMKSTSVLYYRFHGKPKLYKSSYRTPKLEDVVSIIRRQRGVDNVFIYFNNDIDVAAVRNATTLQTLIS